MKINPIVAVLVGIILITVTAVSVFFASQTFLNDKQALPSITPQVTETNESPTTTQSPNPSPTQVGYITGKLCYPSEFIPKGKVVAKRTTDQKIFSYQYPGTDSGAPNNYTLEVEPGSYYVRFEIDGQNYNGYYSNYNVDEGSGEHTLKIATVKLGESLAKIDICDFYYPQNEEPKF